jgi:signal transduction histidine kinase
MRGISPASDVGHAKPGYGLPVRPSSWSRDRLIDALVVLLFLLAEAEAAFSDIEGSRVALLLLPAFWTLPLLLRRRWPVVASLGVLGGLALEGRIAYHGTETQSALIAAIAAFYLLGRRVDIRIAAVAWLLSVLLAASLLESDSGPVTGSDFAFLAIISIAPFLTGVALRNREREATEMTERTARLEREREERAAAAVAEERARIARELHDMIGHAISVITVQAGAARTVLASSPEDAREPLEAIERTGREAMDEMRRLIGVLREMGEPGIAPQPGLGQLDRLAESVTASGLDVELREEGDAGAPLPAAVELAAYRIVQEALTNSMKHGDGGRAQVTVRRSPATLTLEIESDRGTGGDGNGAGHGLVGMRERVDGLGGELRVGPTGDGGYLVRAALPAAGGER